MPNNLQIFEKLGKALLRLPLGSQTGKMAVKTLFRSYCALILIVSAATVSAWVAGGLPEHVSKSRSSISSSSSIRSKLYMSSPDKAPRHDVGGGNPLAQLPADQRERVEKFMEHQNSMPKIGFPVDVRSLVQYNHGFAVMSTNSKS